MPSADEIRAIIRSELGDHYEDVDKRLAKIEDALATGLDDRPGLLERVRDLERAEKTRDRTVWAAATAVAAALGHTLWQIITGHHAG